MKRKRKICSVQCTVWMGHVEKDSRHTAVSSCDDPVLVDQGSSTEVES